MLSASELEDLRAVAEMDLPDVCDIVEMVRASDGRGGFTETPQVALAGVPCRFASITTNPNERIVGGQLTSIETLTFTLPAHTPCNASQHITYNGREFQITGGTADRSVEITKRVQVVELNSGEAWLPPGDGDGDGDDDD